MITTSELSSLLAKLYAAPLEPQKWQRFFDHLCTLTNISSGYLITTSPAEGNLCLAGGGLNFDPEVFRLYNDHYGVNDPYRIPLFENPRLGLIQGDDLLPRATLIESELYNEVLSRFDLEFMNMLSCNCNSNQAELLSLWRSAKHGPINNEASYLLETLVPHIQTALRLRTKVLASEASHLFSEVALDAMSIAALLVTGDGRVRHMNQRAAMYLQTGDVLSLRDGKLVANDSRETARLELLIAAAAASLSKGSEAIPGGAMKVSRVRNRNTLQVTVIPAPEDNQIGATDSFALVFVSDPASSPKSRTAIMQQLYGLTPTEARIANLLLDGVDVRETANRLHITLETCRFQIKRVLAKTGTRRQSELMRLMLSLPGQ